MVVDQIVCIDDLDRRGANLRIEDVLGLIPSFDTVPAWPFELNLGDKKLEDLCIKLASAGTEHEIVADAMFWLAGKEVKILRQDYNRQTVSISYRRSVYVLKKWS